MSFFDIFGGGRNPAQAAEPYLNQIQGIGQQNLSPYATGGSVYDQRVNNPTQFVKDIYSQYSPSEGYKHKEKYLQRALSNAAAAGGYTGGSYDEYNRGELLNGLLGQDMQQWYENVNNANQFGAQQQQQGSNQLADYLGTGLGAQAQNAQYGQAQQNSNLSGLMQALLQGGGYALGGPLGGALANKLGWNWASGG